MQNKMNKDEARKILATEVEDYLKDHKIRKLKFIKHKNVVRKPNTLKLSPCPECGAN